MDSNDRVRAVIVGTGVNQDGRTTGITQPSSAAQEELMRNVYAAAGIDPSETGYVEAHGTGTKVGDPIEAAALHAVFGEGRTSRRPLYIGSLKSNVGHTESASGVISIIKTAMMLEKGLILPNCNFEQPNPAIPIHEWNMKASSISAVQDLDSSLTLSSFFLRSLKS
jgi:acyl transferase domain-containing protein